MTKKCKSFILLTDSNNVDFQEGKEKMKCCPYCGIMLDNDMQSCPKCGKSQNCRQLYFSKTTSIGDTIFFGSYEQNNNTSNGQEPIEWIVLDKQDDMMLIISKYGLDVKPYNIKWVPISWYYCSLRQWLNRDFYNIAFSSSEKSIIQSTTVQADKNPKYSTDPSKATNDKVFLLSITEAEKYLTSENDRKCAPTKYAEANRAYTNDEMGSCWWWLRSSGLDKEFAAFVLRDGSICYGGHRVHANVICVRPVLWVKKVGEYFTDVNGDILESEYNTAICLQNEGKYREAITVFEELNGYKDSAKQIEACQEGIYEVACQLSNEGKYQEAIVAFQYLKSYKDSQERFKKIVHSPEYISTKIVGDTIFLGAYERDNNASNGQEEIEWIVLEKQADKMLLISKYGLDAKRYNSKREDTTWEKCSLRKWLNENFLNTAFTPEEQSKIQNTTLSAEKNPKHSTNPGNATTDKVFLLSITEAEKYVSLDNDSKCVPAECAEAKGVYTYAGCCWWWLRSPGGNQDYAAYVSDGGSIAYYGSSVNSDGGCVRPALWVNLDS